MNKPSPFSKNQYEFFRRSFDSWLNVAEGGKRGGKNVVSTLAQCLQIETHPNKLHLAAGVSIASAKLNILDCDGFGMLNYFEGRCREGEYKNRDCLYVKTATGEKVVLVSGGGKDGDFKLIKGNTYGTAYVTEANECHKAFLREVMDRTISSGRRWVGHDLNPKGPTHPYYKAFLDFHAGQQAANPGYGYNYGHFTIADNMSISKEKLQKETATYPKNSVWYKRDILGLRIPAEGAIYEVFSGNPEKYRTETPDSDYIQVGIDFGGNRSAYTFVASGLKYDHSKLTALMSERHPAKGLTPEDMYQLFDLFRDKVKAKYGKISCAYADSAEQAFINALNIRCPFPVLSSVKNEIVDRIRVTVALMAQGRFFYTEDCETLVAAFEGAVWDEKSLKDKRLDNFTSDIDTLDGFEYSWESEIRGYLYV